MQLIGNYISSTKRVTLTYYSDVYFALRFHPSLIINKSLMKTNLISFYFNRRLNSKEIYKPTKEEWKEICNY